MHTLHLPLSHPTGWKLTPISPGNRAHSSVSSDFLTYLVFWLPLACSLPFRQTLDALNPCYLLPPPTLPAEPHWVCEAPLCPTFLLTWSQQDSPSRSWRCWRSSPGHVHSSGFLSPGRPKTQRNMQPWDRWQRKKREIDQGKKYSLPQLNQLPWVKPDLHGWVFY